MKHELYSDTNSMKPPDVMRRVKSPTAEIGNVDDQEQSPRTPISLEASLTALQRRHNKNVTLNKENQGQGQDSRSCTTSTLPLLNATLWRQPLSDSEIGSTSTGNPSPYAQYVGLGLDQAKVSGKRSMTCTHMFNYVRGIQVREDSAISMVLIVDALENPTDWKSKAKLKILHRETTDPRSKAILQGMIDTPSTGDEWMMSTSTAPQVGVSRVKPPILKPPSTAKVVSNYQATGPCTYMRKLPSFKEMKRRHEVWTQKMKQSGSAHHPPSTAPQVGVSRVKPPNTEVVANYYSRCVEGELPPRYTKSTPKGEDLV